MKVVVDASVAVKWFVEEKGSDAAMGLLADSLRKGGDLQLVAPQFLLVEVLAVIGKRARNKAVDASYPTRVLQVLRKLKLGLTPDAELLDHATHLSVTLQHPLYDCLYLALSRRLSARLATFDKGLGDIARRDGLLLELR